LPAPLRTVLSAKQLLGRFKALLPATLLASWLAEASQGFYERAFTPLVTLWYCIFQRLENDHTLGGVLADARAGGADRLSPPGKPLSKQLHSTATTSFSDARQRLPLEIFDQTLRRSAQQLYSWARGIRWHGWNVALLDGSTFRMRPHKDIPKQFHPHRPGNCKKQPYWCLARVVAGFCLATGAVLHSAVGSLKASEQSLAAQLLTMPWGKTLFVADRNFGVYSVVRAAQAASAQTLVRLTKIRAAKLAKQAGVRLVNGLDQLITWSPTRHDQCPEHLERTPVQGRLLVMRVQRPGFRPLTLYLFTSLTDVQKYPPAPLAQLYAQRWQVELYLRFVKTQMDLGFLDCQSPDMARKEWLAGLIAYNLIRSVMVAAAARANIPVRILSFSRSRQVFLKWLHRWAIKPADLSSWERLLVDIARLRHPRRRKDRPPEPRSIRRFQINFPKLEGDRAIARRKLIRALKRASKS